MDLVPRRGYPFHHSIRIYMSFIVGESLCFLRSPYGHAWTHESVSCIFFRDHAFYGVLSYLEPPVCRMSRNERVRYNHLKEVTANKMSYRWSRQNVHGCPRVMTCHAFGGQTWSILCMEI